MVSFRAQLACLLGHLDDFANKEKTKQVFEYQFMFQIWRGCVFYSAKLHITS